MPCGLSPNQDYPYLYWILQSNHSLSPVITACVNHCPPYHDFKCDDQNADTCQANGVYDTTICI